MLCWFLGAHFVSWAYVVLLLLAIGRAGSRASPGLSSFNVTARSFKSAPCICAVPVQCGRRAYCSSCAVVPCHKQLSAHCAAEPSTIGQCLVPHESQCAPRSLCVCFRAAMQERSQRMHFMCAFRQLQRVLGVQCTQHLRCQVCVEVCVGAHFPAVRWCLLLYLPTGFRWVLHLVKVNVCCMKAVTHVC